jgi:hypothetical protein
MGSSKEVKCSMTVGSTLTVAPPLMSGALPMWKFSMTEIQMDWFSIGQSRGVEV